MMRQKNIFKPYSFDHFTEIYKEKMKERMTNCATYFNQSKPFKLLKTELPRHLFPSNL